VLFLFLIFFLSLSSYAYVRYRALFLDNLSTYHSLPSYHGLYVALWCFIPTFFIFLLWNLFEPYYIEAILLSSLPEEFLSLSALELQLVFNNIKAFSSGAIFLEDPGQSFLFLVNIYQESIDLSRTFLLIILLSSLLFSFIWAINNSKPSFKARDKVEGFLKFFLSICSLVAILTTFGIILSVIFESIRFFEQIPVIEFLFGTSWSPQTAIRADQVGSSGSFGVIPLFLGTILISCIAMFVAVPIGLMSAIYLSEYANPTLRSVMKPMLEILAGIPTVVYGYFAAVTVAPIMRDIGESMNLTVSSESALGAGLVMGIMIIPFVSSLSDDALNAVPNSMRDGSYGLGATTSETIKKVILPAALPGIIGGILLALSRAIGETMIVVMAAGLSANLTINPFEAVTTVTVQIVTLLVGDQEFDSPKTLAAFALGLVLFSLTLLLNVIALKVVRRYQEQYE